MRRIVLGAVLLLCCSAALAKETAAGQAAAAESCAIAATDNAIRSVADQWREAYNAGDAEKVANLYTPDAYYLTQHFVTGIVRGHDAIKAYVKLGIDAKYHIDAIEVLATDCSRDMAYTISRYTATNNGQKAMGVNLVVLRKIAGQWKIVGHEAAVPDPASAIQSLQTPKGTYQ